MFWENLAVAKYRGGWCFDCEVCRQRIADAIALDDACRELTLATLI
jgi:hypothetical protein